MSEAQSRGVVKRAQVLVSAAVAALLIGAAAVLVLRSFHAHALDDDAAVHAAQYVTTATPAVNSAGLPVTLPGTLLGVTEATVYARSSGYIVRWSKDIGASVKRGDLLAEVTAPEIDQQLFQAEATRAQTAASESLAKSTADRWTSLRAKDAVTQQDLDERLSTYRQAEADMQAAEANVSRLRSLQGFNRIIAPFDGVVTQRNIDVGDLVQGGNSGTGKALFTVAQVDPLRLYVYVPQAYAHQIAVGDTVVVTLAERGGEKFQGTIARTARAIDTVTRTMQVEIRVPNAKGELIAGSYVQVLLPIKGDNSGMVVPTNALLFRPSGIYVAIVDQSGHVRLALVKLGTDFGTEVEVLGGLDGHDRFIINPSDSLADGDVVTLTTPSPVPPSRS
jgi:RND family efflux transporter MFP subunit